MDELKARLLVIGPLDPNATPASPYLLVEDEGRVIVVSGGSFAEICEGGLLDATPQAVRHALRVSGLTPVYLSPPRTLPEGEFLSEEMNAWTRRWWKEFVAETCHALENEARFMPAAA